MPLDKSGSKASVSRNISRLVDEGRDQNQAVAIALDVARMVKRQAGGPVNHVGPISSSVPGRTDNHAMSVPAGSYVLPADHISSLGQGNTAAGMEVVGAMFGPEGPYARSGFAKGGPVHDPVDVMTAGGEFVIPPEVVAAIGGGDIKRGHEILDQWVVSNRKKHVKTLRGLPGPAKS